MFFTNNTWYVTSDWEYLYFYSHSHSPPPLPFRWEASCSPSHRIIPGKKFAVARLHLGGERQRNTVTFGRKNPFICRKFEVLNANLKCWTQFHSKCYTAKLKYSCPRTRHIDPGQGLNTDWPVQSPLSVTSSQSLGKAYSELEIFISIQGSIWKFIAKLAILLKET